MNPSFDLLQSLIYARGPCGQEDEVREVCRAELHAVADEVWVDPAGNLIGKVNGMDSSKAIRVMVHMDEISMIVKRINEDGSLRVNALGGLFPFSVGQGPVDILGDNHSFTGILSFGSLHITKESPWHKLIPEDHRGQGKTPLWEDVFVVTRKTAQELKEAGVHPGTRVVIARSRRTLHVFQDCIGGYFFDNRASIAIALSALQKMKEKGQRPQADVYFVATCNEELGGHGASYASRTLPGDTTFAIDVGPVSKEYCISLSPSPIIVYQDGAAVYDKTISDHLRCLGEELGLPIACSIWGGYSSDSSLALSRGQSAKSVLLCFPVENTHGFEIMHKDSMAHCATLLAAYLEKSEVSDFKKVINASEKSPSCCH
jgi:putative aminopeptidase FrvX